MKRALLAVAIAVTACTDRIENLTCSDLELEAVDMSKGSLIKITNARVIRRSPSELVCKGTGVFADNNDAPITYRAYTDEDHEIMVSASTDDSQIDADSQREFERVSQAFNQTIDQIYRDDN